MEYEELWRQLIEQLEHDETLRKVLGGGVLRIRTVGEFVWETSLRVPPEEDAAGAGLEVCLSVDSRRLRDFLVGTTDDYFMFMNGDVKLEGPEEQCIFVIDSLHVARANMMSAAGDIS